MASSVPAKNIYYLLLYAWNRLPEGRAIDVSGVESPELPNLVASVLVQGLHQLQRRGFDRGYVEYDDDLVRPRGRMRLGDTFTRGLLARVRVACTVDELSRDVLPNQIIKSTIARLLRTDDVDERLRSELAAATLGLSDVRLIEIASRDFGRIQLRGGNSFYGLLLRVCALVHEALMPAPGTGRYRFRDIIADPQVMGYIFQDFVRNFYRLEQSQYGVKGDSFTWPLMEGYGRGQALMPVMNTDVSLTSERRTIVIECKWTPSTLQRGRLRSDHLYQLSAYVRHHRRALTMPSAVEGLLLYPLADDPVDVAVRINEQWLRVRTLDLTTDWPRIHAQLIALLEPEISEAGQTLSVGPVSKHDQDDTRVAVWQ
jgi:5-methylcytosine-specific restriction enzyme subunit McrC